MNENSTRRRFFQLNLATIMLLMVIVAVVVAWWSDHSRLMKELQNRELEIRVYNLINTDAGQIAKTVTEQFPDTPYDPVRLSVDQRLNAIIISGHASKLDQIQALLQRLDE